MGKKDNSTNLLMPRFSTWRQIFDILKELYMSTYKWTNMPPSVNTRFLEERLFHDGYAIFFRDEDLGELVLGGTLVGLDVYNEPLNMTAIAPTGYRKDLVNHKSGVVIYNNNTKTTPYARLEQYAKRIYNLERTIDVNVQAQKTPFLLIVKDEKTRLSIQRLMQQIDGFDPFVLADKSLLGEDSVVQYIGTEAPFVSDKLEEIKRKLWNEALSFIGIENNFSEKNERLTANEVLISNGLAIANKNARKLSRERAIEEINTLFMLDITLEVNNVMMTESPIEGDPFGGVE